MHLPPLPALRALEALDRLGSATAVAQELNLTQSAVSRQLKTLEEHLGVALFLRGNRALRLTPQARDFALAVRDTLDRLTEAAMVLRLDPSGGALNLAILPSFGMRWLVPRLPEFTARHPEVTLNMTTRLRPFSFAAEPFDAALHFGVSDWPDTHRLRLMTETVQPLMAPTLSDAAPLSLEALRRLPLLHIQTRPEAWARWFMTQGLSPGPLPGPTFDQFTAIVQAALHGLGVALLPDYLTQAERAAGTLRPAHEAPPVSLGAYYLVWPADRPPSPALCAFRDWLALHSDDEETLPR